MTAPRTLPAWLLEVATAAYDPTIRGRVVEFVAAAYQAGWEDATREAGVCVVDEVIEHGFTVSERDLYQRDDDPAQDRSPLPAGVDGYPVGGRKPPPTDASWIHMDHARRPKGR